MLELIFEIELNKIFLNCLSTITSIVFYVSIHNNYSKNIFSEKKVYKIKRYQNNTF